MRATVPCEQFVQAVRAIGRVVKPTWGPPRYQCLLLRVEDGRLRLAGIHGLTDTRIQTVLPAHDDEAGGVCVKAKQLKSVAAWVDSSADAASDITLERTADGLICKVGGTRCLVPIEEDGDCFPHLPVFPSSGAAEIYRYDFVPAVRRVLSAIGDTTLADTCGRYVYNCLCIHTSSGQAEIIALHQYRAAVAHVPIRGELAGLIVAAPIVYTQALALLGASNSVSIAADERMIYVQLADYLIASRRPDGNFPPGYAYVSAMITDATKKAKGTAVVEAHVLAQWLKRAAAAVKAYAQTAEDTGDLKGRDAVVITTEPDRQGLVLQPARATGTDAQVVVPAKYTGPAIRAAYDVYYLRQMADALAPDKCVLQISLRHAKDPLVITTEGFGALIAPVLIDQR
jgi:DNA polymerase III sliding clamp (beta) subunit (PCNA family)